VRLDLKDGVFYNSTFRDFMDCHFVTVVNVITVVTYEKRL
jgi:hypothetical protein